MFLGVNFNPIVIIIGSRTISFIFRRGILITFWSFYDYFNSLLWCTITFQVLLTLRVLLRTHLPIVITCPTSAGVLTSDSQTSTKVAEGLWLFRKRLFFLRWFLNNSSLSTLLWYFWFLWAFNWGFTTTAFFRRCIWILALTAIYSTLSTAAFWVRHLFQSLLWDNIGLLHLTCFEWLVMSHFPITSSFIEDILLLFITTLIRFITWDIYGETLHVGMYHSCLVLLCFCLYWMPTSLTFLGVLFDCLTLFIGIGKTETLLVLDHVVVL